MSQVRKWFLFIFKGYANHANNVIFELLKMKSFEERTLIFGYGCCSLRLSLFIIIFFLNLWLTKSSPQKMSPHATWLAAQAALLSCLDYLPTLFEKVLYFIPKRVFARLSCFVVDSLKPT